jgi:hypothetical protein
MPSVVFASDASFEQRWKESSTASIGGGRSIVARRIGVWKEQHSMAGASW